MFELFLALFLAFGCPAHNHTNCNNDNTVTTQGTGGENGHVPPGNTPPPPPGD
ncbi:MAG TPA: hypothetical protein VK668_19375 [Mucilaginibacter sp.]|nr:hypothetical protein [Mucilaginibacter sp.]